MEAFDRLSEERKIAFIAERVSRYYWQEDVNCATTALKVLAEIFKVRLHPQVLAAATGMHGAAGYGAQCGLVEGSLMFMGVQGKEKKMPAENFSRRCQSFAGEFEEEFGSLLCRQLRPQGFRAEDPPHLCEGLTCRGIWFSVAFIQKQQSENTARGETKG